MTGKIRSIKPGALLVLGCAIGFVSCAPQTTSAQTLDDMTGCWESVNFDATSLLADSTNPASATVVYEKMLLQFSHIEDTDNLVFGRIYEWDKEPTYVLGPTYQNGVFHPLEQNLTFGYPKGSLDHVTLIDVNTLLYVHSKSSENSAMAVRRLMRIDCDEAKNKEQNLLRRQSELRE